MLPPPCITYKEIVIMRSRHFVVFSSLLSISLYLLLRAVSRASTQCLYRFGHTESSLAGCYYRRRRRRLNNILHIILYCNAYITCLISRLVLKEALGCLFGFFSLVITRFRWASSRAATYTRTLNRINIYYIIRPPFVKLIRNLDLGVGSHIMMCVSRVSF